MLATKLMTSASISNGYATIPESRLHEVVKALQDIRVVVEEIEEMTWAEIDSDDREDEYARREVAITEIYNILMLR